MCRGLCAFSFVRHGRHLSPHVRSTATPETDDDEFYFEKTIFCDGVVFSMGNKICSGRANTTDDESSVLVAW